MNIKMKKLTKNQILRYQGYFVDTIWSETQANLSFLVHHIVRTCGVKGMLNDMTRDKSRTLEENIEVHTLKKLLEVFDDEYKFIYQ